MPSGADWPGAGAVYPGRRTERRGGRPARLMRSRACRGILVRSSRMAASWAAFPPRNHQGVESLFEPSGANLKLGKPRSSSARGKTLALRGVGDGLSCDGANFRYQGISVRADQIVPTRGKQGLAVFKEVLPLEESQEYPLHLTVS